MMSISASIVSAQGVAIELSEKSAMNSVALPRLPAAVDAPKTISESPKTLRGIIRQFTPNWFTVTMGTGILSLALNQVPFATRAVRAVAEGLWLLNIVLFLIFGALYVGRWFLFPREARRIFGHSVMPMFFGAIPMGLATIVNGFLVFGVEHWGRNAVSIALPLWQIDVAMAILCGVGVPYLMITRHIHTLEEMTAVWLLPIVAAEVAAASAALLAPQLSSPHAALQVLILGYALWAFSTPLAMSVLVILVLRMVLHKLPRRDMAASSWLALGPIGTAALGLMLLGADAPHAFSAAGFPGVGDVAAGVGVIGGAVLWGYGMWWLLAALMVTARYLRQGMPFNLGWWGFTFPVGVYSLATLALARYTNLEFFIAIGSGLVIGLVFIWLTVAALTVHGIWHRHLFVSPCLIKGSIPGDLEAVVLEPNRVPT
jgi:C4-dicarboxylate transporter/malic acid transport protein